MTIEEQLLNGIEALEEECATLHNAILGKADKPEPRKRVFARWKNPYGVCERIEIMYPSDEVPDVADRLEGKE